ncbi:MAG: hypothetical protein CMJ20_11885 [Phycisphaeraceae bacterium]|nr:hypothetical protein [Phycisphaeraceae bacterium]|tara:strand:+ start:2391 stop:2795 length:405 start_codon:yes stop_codon:yes gene_type:complete
MTWHYFTGDHYSCESCRTCFVPYEDSLPCPRCGEPATEPIGFIGEAASGLAAHKWEFGDYTPPVYTPHSRLEMFFIVICQVFDAISGQDDFERALDDYLQRCEFDREYEQSHLRDLAIKIHQRMEANTAEQAER